MVCQPNPRQSSELLSLIVERVQFKLFWMAFDYKTTALTKVAGVLHIISYQWPVLLALKDMRLVPLIHWVKVFGALHSHWMVKGRRVKHIDVLKMLEIKNKKQQTKQKYHYMCTHTPTHTQELLVQQFFILIAFKLRFIFCLFVFLILLCYVEQKSSVWCNLTQISAMCQLVMIICLSSGFYFVKGE